MLPEKQADLQHRASSFLRPQTRLLNMSVKSCRDQLLSSARKAGLEHMDPVNPEPNMC